MIDILRRLTVSVVALATILIPAWASTAPAEAATSRCTLVVPAKVAISQPYHGIEVRTTGCTPGRGGIAYAAWDGYHPREGQQAQLMIQSNQRQYWNLYAYAPVGRITWRPMGAFSEDFGGSSLAQNTPTSDVRLASRARLAVTTTGPTVTLTASAKRYSPSNRTFIGWRSGAGTLQYRTVGNQTWHHLRNVTLSSDGTATWRYADWGKREYRLVMKDQSNVWGSTSATVRR